jgi:multidrug efflux pump subunit AcrA (membrane-fusion protein)
MLLLVVCAAAFAGCSKQEASTTGSSTGNGAAPPIEVAVAPVIERAVQRSFEVVGSFVPEDDVTLSTQAPGELGEISVDIGSKVRDGQVVARLDSRELKLRVEQAEAGLRQAEARLGISRGQPFDIEKQPDVRQARAALERARYDWNAAQDLVNHGDISRQQHDVARRAFEQAEARYQAALETVRNLQAVVEERRAAAALANKQLGDAAIISPIDGEIKTKHASRGEYVRAGDPVVTIVKINPLRLRLEAPESLAPFIARGQKVTVRVDSYGDREFHGTIRRINPSLDERNRTLIAEAEVVNPGGLLKPGMFARARVLAESASTALLVPDKAVVSIAGLNKVFVVEGGQAVERQVTLGAHDGNLVEIVEGIKTGEVVITSNTDKLQDSLPVSTPNQQR